MGDATRGGGGRSWSVVQRTTPSPDLTSSCPASGNPFAEVIPENGNPFAEADASGPSANPFATDSNGPSAGQNPFGEEGEESAQRDQSGEGKMKVERLHHEGDAMDVKAEQGTERAASDAAARPRASTKNPFAKMKRNPFAKRRHTDAGRQTPDESACEPVDSAHERKAGIVGVEGPAEPGAGDDRSSQFVEPQLPPRRSSSSASNEAQKPAPAVTSAMTASLAAAGNDVVRPQARASTSDRTDSEQNPGGRPSFSSYESRSGYDIGSYGAPKPHIGSFGAVKPDFGLSPDDPSELDAVPEMERKVAPTPGAAEQVEAAAATVEEHMEHDDRVDVDQEKSSKRMSLFQLGSSMASGGATPQGMTPSGFTPTLGITPRFEQPQRKITKYGPYGAGDIEVEDSRSRGFSQMAAKHASWALTGMATPVGQQFNDNMSDRSSERGGRSPELVASVGPSPVLTPMTTPATAGGGHEFFEGFFISQEAEDRFMSREEKRKSYFKPRKAKVDRPSKLQYGEYRQVLLEEDGSANIIDTTTAEDETGKKYTNYVIEVRETEGAPVVHVYRRYNMFDKLNTALTELFGAASLPKLPAKSMFGNLKGDFVRKRRWELNAYLVQIVSNEAMRTSEPFLEFLGETVETKELEVERADEGDLEYDEEEGEKVLKSLEYLFYQEDFDPFGFVVRCFLKGRGPPIMSDEGLMIRTGIFDPVQIEEVQREKEAQVKALEGKLQVAISNNYDLFVEGTKLVQEVERDIALSRVICLNSRRNLGNFRNVQSDKAISVLDNLERKSRLTNVVDSLSKVSRLMHLERCISSEEDYATAIQLCSEWFAESEFIEGVQCLSEASARVEAVAGSIREKMDESFSVVCREFNPEKYERVVRGYRCLGNFHKMVDSLQNSFVRAIEQSTHEVMLAHVMMPTVNDDLIEEPSSYEFSRDLGADAEVTVTRPVVSQAEGEKKLTLYELEVKPSAGAMPYTIWRRYNEFKEMHDTLAKSAEGLPQFPGKRLFGNFGDEFVRKRRRDLDTYMQALMEVPDVLRYRVVRNFLHSEEVANTQDTKKEELEKYLGKNIEGLDYEKMCSLLVQTQFLDCLTASISTLYDIMENHHKMAQWHLTNTSTLSTPSVVAVISPDASMEKARRLSHRETTAEGPDGQHGDDIIDFEESKFHEAIVQTRRFIYEVIQRRLSYLFSHVRLVNFKVDPVFQAFHSVLRFMDIGESFCGGASSGHLYDVLRRSMRQFFEQFHRDRLQAVKRLLENETFVRLPTTSDFGVKEHVPSQFTRTEEGEGVSFERFLENGNPFQTTERPSRRLSRELSQLSQASGGGNSPASVPVLSEASAIATTTTVNIMKFVDRYVQFMEVVPAISGDAFLGIVHLFDYYVYTLHTFFYEHSRDARKASIDVDAFPDALRRRLRVLRTMFVEARPRSQSRFSKNDASTIEDGGRQVVVPALSRMVDIKSPARLFGTLERCVGVESLFTMRNYIMSLRPMLEKRVTTKKGRQDLASFFDEVDLVTVQLQGELYAELAAALVPASRYVELIGASKYDITDIVAEGSPFVDVILEDLEALAARMDLLEEQHMPKDVKTRILERTIHELCNVLMDGFGDVANCTFEGRVLMRQDITSLERGLEKILGSIVKVGAEAERVHEYVGAFQIGEESAVVEWIQNHQECGRSRAMKLMTNGLAPGATPAEHKKMMSERTEKVNAIFARRASDAQSTTSSALSPISPITPQVPFAPGSAP